MHKTADQMLDRLKKAGFRLTRQRVDIIEYLAARNDHPSVRQIHTALRGHKPAPSLATVYNTLSTLVDLGCIRQLEFEAEDNRFDTNLAPHINLVCTECGDIIDLDHRLPMSAAEIQRRLGFEVIDFRVEYRGTCAGCRRKE